MKILMTLPDPVYEGNQQHGIKIFVENVGKKLSEQGHEVHILCKSAFAERKVNGLFVHGYKSFPPYKLFDPLLLWFNAKKLINKHKIDVIQINGIWYSILINYFIKLPKLITIHNSIKCTYKSILKRLILKTTLNRATAIHTVADFIQEEILETTDIPKKKIKTIYNGANISLFNSKDVKPRELELTKKRLKLKNSYPILICVSALRPKQKRQDLLIKASRKIASKYPNHKILFVGSGNLQFYQALVKKNRVEKHIEFLGEIKHDKIVKYLAISDIFILPTNYEGLPLVLLEAMAVGLPVIASNITSTAEIIHKTNGILVNNNPNAFANAIINLVKNKNKLKFIGKVNRKKIENKFTWELNAKKLERKLLELKHKNK